MIGQTIESQNPFPWAALCLLLAAVTMLFAAVLSHSINWAVGAILPVLTGIGLLLAREKPFSATFTEQSVEVTEPPQTVRYAAMEGLKAKGRPDDPSKKGPPAYAIQILHADGVLRVPAHLNAPSDDVYRFLLSRFPLGGSREINPLLADYARMHEETFGVERVWTYAARRHLGSRFPSRKATAFWTAALLAGAAWGAVGLTDETLRPWSLGFMAMFISIVMLLAVRSESGARKTQVRNWRQSGLVISPVGLALVQGDEKGEMRWDELRGLRMKTGSEFLTSSDRSPTSGIELILEGASFIVADVYDRPLPIILERIKHYWR
jgi:hypothetical protein